MKFYYGVNPEEKREKLIKSKAAKPFVDEIIKIADDAISNRTPSLKFSDYMLFFKNGNRTVFEYSYFEIRRKCSSLMISYWLTQDEKYFEPLIDHIFYICDEFSWCLPAHSSLTENTVEYVITRVDLFQAETARLLAEIKMCVGEKLPGFVKERMEYEVKRRIFPTLKQGKCKDYTWFSGYNNWTAVCAAGCAMAALCFAEDSEKDYYMNLFKECVDRFIDGFEDDGCCLEGMSYWGYGISQFAIFAEALKEYTNGKSDYYKLPKVKEIALFPQRIRMSDSKVVAFSDGGENFNFKIGLISKLKTEYSEFKLPDIKYGAFGGNIDSIFEFLWFDENYEGEPLTPETTFFEQAKWFVKRQENFCFAAKGGCNNEPHNHNDIGAFMITSGDETFISDPGRGEYVKETFFDDTRYEFVHNSSRGHSVPIINGKYQEFGSEFSAKNIRNTENSFELDIEGAYEKGLVNKINRKFSITDKVTLTDTFEFSDKTETVTERFVAKIKPELKDGYVDFGIGRILFDKERYVPSFDTETFVAENGKDIVTLYMTDFKAVSENERVFEFIFKII